MNHNHSTNASKHMLIMLACCLIPIGLILAVGVFGVTLGSLTPFLPFAIVLLCPLLMFFMMRGMGHDHGEGETHHTQALPALPGRPLAEGSPSADVKPGAALDASAASHSHQR